ncbi:MAG: hypothetical protein IE890_04220 [Arcobacter sp.]|nr:hypothetical protein [Arcobacter sp.]
MALQPITIDLTSPTSYTFPLHGYGIFVKKAPTNLNAYFIYDNNPNKKIILGVQQKVPGIEFRSFTISNQTPLPGKILEMYYAERPEDMSDLPDSPNATVDSTLEETNTILTSIEDKTFYVDTRAVKITDSGDIAKETTVNSIETNTDNINTNIIDSNTKLDTIISQTGDNATAANQTSTNTKLDTINNNLSDLKTNTDGLETLSLNIYDILNSGYIRNFIRYCYDNKLVWIFSKHLTADADLVLENPSGSGKIIKVIENTISNNDADDLIVNVYKNSTITTSTTYTAVNSDFSVSTAHAFIFHNATSITAGTTVYESITYKGSTFIKEKSDLYNEITLNPGENVHINFSGTTPDYNFSVIIAEL